MTGPPRNLWADQHQKGLSWDSFTSKNSCVIRYGRADAAPGRARGVVLLLNGRSEFMEKYNEVVSELVHRRYKVFSLDWRGQGLSCRETANRHKGYVDNYGDYLYDLELFYTRFVKAEGLPVTIVAHSMGGHIALRFMGKHRGSIQKAFLVSPMIDINTAPFPGILARFLARKACAAGFSRHYVFGGGDYCPEKNRFKGNILTHDPERFLMEQKAIADNPDLALGGVTWGWLKASFDSIDLVKSPAFTAGIKTPIVMVSAEQDTVVSTSAQKRLCGQLPHCRFVSIPGAFHEIFHETDRIRQIFWSHFDQ